MTSLLARHPLVSGVAMMMVQFVLLVGGFRAMARFVPSGPVWVELQEVFWFVSGSLAAGAGCWLTMLRRRSGQSAWPACWLAAIFPIQAYTQTIAAAGTLTWMLGGPDVFRQVMGDPTLYVAAIVFPGNLVTSPAVLVGVLIGLIAAHVMYRRGRWMQISALPSATGAPAATFLVRHPLAATALVMLPCTQYAWLFLSRELRWTSSTPRFFWIPDLPPSAAALFYLFLVGGTALAAGLAVARSRRAVGLPIGWLGAVVLLTAALSCSVYTLVADVPRAAWEWVGPGSRFLPAMLESLVELERSPALRVLGLVSASGGALLGLTATRHAGVPRWVSRFVARHPLLSAAVLLSPQGGLLAVLMGRLGPDARHLTPMAFSAAWCASAALGAAAVTAALTLARLSHGMRLVPLALLSVTIPVQLTTHLLLALTLTLYDGYRFSPFGGVLLDSVPSLLSWPELYVGLVLAGAGIGIGMLLGRDLQWRLFRTGRWTPPNSAAEDG